MVAEKIDLEPISPQQKKARATRQALLNAARERFTVDGYAASSLDAIASDAGVTKGAFFHHFKDKPALFKEVWNELEEEMIGSVQAAADETAKHSAQENPYAPFIAGCAVYFDFAQRPDYRQIVMIDSAGVLGEFEWRRIEATLRTAAIAQGLSILHHKKAIRTSPTKALVVMICGAVSGAGFALAREEEGIHKEDLLARIEATLRRL